MFDQCGRETIKDPFEILRVVFVRFRTVHILAKSLHAFFKCVMLLKIGFHESYLAGVRFDFGEEELVLVVVVRVDPFVYALAEEHEICDVFGLGDLLILQVHGVEVAKEEVVYEAHIGRNFERFFGDLEMLEMRYVTDADVEGHAHLLRSCRRRHESEWLVSPRFRHDA
jgi:hypothetical protein